MQAVEKTRQEKLPAYVFPDENSALRLIENGKQSLTINLHNLVSTCLQANKNEWANLIEKFLVLVNQETLNGKNNYDDLKSLIFVQIYPKEILQQVDIPFLSREIIPETIIIPVLDSPDRIESINSETIEKWGKTLDEIFSLALENTKNLLRNFKFENIGNGSKISVCESENILTANLALFLSDREYSKGTGVVFSIPNRNTILILPSANTQDFKNDLTVMGNLSTKIANNSPYPLTSNLYWLIDSAFIKLPYTIDSNKFSFYPPQKFLDIFNQ